MFSHAFLLVYGQGVLLLSVHLLSDQYLLHLYPAYVTELSTLLSPLQLLIALINGVVRGVPLHWFSW